MMGKVIRRISGKNFIKNTVVINYCKYNKTLKEPTVVAEEIALKLFTLIDNFCLNKYGEDLLTPVVLEKACNSEAFSYIKESVSELQVIEINSRK
jgi:hypothetical protein